MDHSLDDRGAAPRPQTVREVANLLLKARLSTPPPTVGIHWVTNFVRRHPGLRRDSRGDTTTEELFVKMESRLQRGLTLSGV
jgi:hypothetical protein